MSALYPSHSEHSAFDTLSSRQYQLLAGLLATGVTFVVIGGYAVRAHGHRRVVDDLDIVIARTSDNLMRLRGVLEKIGAKNLDELYAHLQDSRRKVVWDGVEFFSSMEGFEFEAIYATCITVQHGDLSIPVISKVHLIESKRLALRASNRGDKSSVDGEDLAALTHEDEGDV